MIRYAMKTTVLLCTTLLFLVNGSVHGKSRPLSEWERFRSESSMANYLNRLVGTYLDPSIFHLSIHLQGEVNSENVVAHGLRPDVVLGKEVDPNGEQDELEMLPALPFYNKRIQKTKEIRAQEFISNPNEPGLFQVATPSGEVISISRITVNLLFDSLVDEKAVNFLTSLIQSTLGLDPRRGDNIVVQMVGFPNRNLASVTNRVMDAHLRSDSTQHAQSMAQYRRMGQSMALYVSLALIIAGGLLFLAINKLSRSRTATEIQTTMNGTTGEGNALALPDLIASPGESASSSEIRSEVHSNYSQNHWGTSNVNENENLGLMERARLELEEGIIRRPDEVAFILEAWVLEQESATPKILFLLGARRAGLVGLFAGWMSRQVADRLSEGLHDETWRQIRLEEAEEVARDWLARSRDLGVKGRLSVLHHIDPESRARLIEENTAQNAWIMVFSLPAASRFEVFQRIGMNAALGLIRAGNETPEPNALQIKALEWELITHLIQKAGRSDAKETVLKLAQELLHAQPFSQQADFLERLSELDADMASELRSMTVLWSDLEEIENVHLLEASRILSRTELLYLLSFDDKMGKRILDGRPEREQLMLWEMVGLLENNTVQMNSACQKFLRQLAKIKVIMKPENLAQAA